MSIRQKVLWTIYIIRKTLSLPFLLIGGVFFYTAEFIAGEKHMWRPDIARKQVIKDHKYHMQAMAMRKGKGGFRVK